ncbi:MAG: hypothetical protein IKR23_06255 [Lachnospiraceae bacterium]|nr:hypothetical protein [Lachnospiraceae bacterium]
MNNREIEERLRNAAKKVTPDVMDEVYKRIETGDGSDNIVPMDLSARRNRRSAWIPVLASAAALMLVLNVGMFVHYHSGKGNEIVELKPDMQASAQDGAQLIERIVQMDPEFTPESLSAYSVEELDTILRATQTRKEYIQEETVAAAEPETDEPAEVQEIDVTEDPEAAIVETDARIAEAEGTETDGDATTAAVSDNAIVTAGGDEDPQPTDREEVTEDNGVLTEDGAFAAVLKDAGVDKESITHSLIESMIHTSYGTLYVIDFETEKFSYHYRITESGTLLSAGRELKEDKEAE